MRHQTSITAHTIFHKTRKPLMDWFWSIFLVASRSTGCSARQFQYDLGVSYQTAWTWCHKIRKAMHDRDMFFLRIEGECVLLGVQEVSVGLWGCFNPQFRHIIVRPRRRRSISALRRIKTAYLQQLLVAKMALVLLIIFSSPISRSIVLYIQIQRVISTKHI